MRKVSLGVLVVGLVLALGLNVADAQPKPSAGGMGGDLAGRCGGMMGPGMMRGPMMGGGGRMMGPGMTGGPMGRCGRMTGACNCGMTGKGMMGRHMWMKGEMGMSGMHHRLWHYIMSLDLDQKQKAGIWKIKTGLMKDMIRKKADLRIAALDLHELLHADKVDMNQVKAKVKEMEGLKSSMLLSGIEAAEAVKSKLTAEQRTKLEDMMESPPRCIMMGEGMTSGSMTDEDMSGDDMTGDNGMMGRTPQSSD
jgi:Spy/CpxP family protein refolding chaperone